MLGKISRLRIMALCWMSITTGLHAASISVRDASLYQSVGATVIKVDAKSSYNDRTPLTAVESYNGSSASASSTYYGKPRPTIELSVLAQSNSPYIPSNSSAYSTLHYYFAGVGISGKTFKLNYKAIGNYNVIAQNDYSAEAIIGVSIAGRDIIDKDSTIEGPRYSSGLISGYFILNSNTEYEFDLYNEIYAHPSIKGHSEAGYFARSEVHSIVDPFLEIDSLYSNDFAFVLSRGVSNEPLSVVPLPSTAPMFGAALLGLAGLSYAASWKKAAAAV